VKRIAARKQCSVAEAVYWYNLVAKDGSDPTHCTVITCVFMESTTRCPLSHRELEIRNTLGTLCGSNHRAAGAIHASPMVGESGLKRARGLKLAPHSRPRDNKKNTYDTSLFICICMSFSRPEVGVVFNRKSKSFK